MKKLFLTMIAAVLTLTAQAQLREDAFIIRTTDGAAQGLLFGDVEKITFSNLDDEGVLHTGIYYQELHYPDTIIRVPVSDITEVSFEKPRVKLKPNVVFHDDDELFGHLWYCHDTENGHILGFDYDLNDFYLPEVGQKIIYTGKSKVVDGAFGGLVIDVRKGPTGREVETVRLESIMDIYDELIGVEVVTEESPGVRECLRRNNALLSDDDPRRAPMRIDGSANTSLPFDLSLSYDFLDDGDLPEWGPDGALQKGKAFTITGGVRGSIELRLAYEFCSERNFLSVGTTYDYTPYFDLSFASNSTWTKPFYEPLATPILSIPLPSAPVFVVALGGAPFISLSGSANVKISKTLPTTKVRTLAYYLDGIYRSAKANVNEDDGVPNNGEFYLSLNLEGSVKAGLLLGFYIGTKSFFKNSVGIMAELSVGPKLSGAIGIIPRMPQEGEEYEGGMPNTIAYSAMKEWNISATLCSVDLSLNYYQEVMGKPKSYQFASMSFDKGTLGYSLLPSFVPPSFNGFGHDFSDWQTRWKCPGYAKISIPSPEGNSFLPIKPSCLIYDEDDTLISGSGGDGIPYYWWGSADIEEFKNMTGNWFNWLPNKKVRLYPSYHLMGHYDPFRAEPYRETSVEANVYTHAVKLDKIDDYHYNINFSGAVDDILRTCPHLGDVSIVYATSPDQLELSPHERIIKADTDPETSTFSLSFINDDGVFQRFKFGTTYYYRAVAEICNRVNNGNFKCYWIYGDIQNFRLPDPPEECTMHNAQCTSNDIGTTSVGMK